MSEQTKILIGGMLRKDLAEPLCEDIKATFGNTKSLRNPFYCSTYNYALDFEVDSSSLNSYIPFILRALRRGLKVVVIERVGKNRINTSAFPGLPPFSIVYAQTYFGHSEILFPAHLPHLVDGQMETNQTPAYGVLKIVG